MGIKKIFIGKEVPEGWIAPPASEYFIRLPYKNCSVDEVYVDHSLELYSPEQIVEMLTEWRRVIRLGGTFTIAFTDVVRAIFLYQRSVISSEELDSAILPSHVALSKQRMENLLVMRYSTVQEIHKPLTDKKLWTTILSAQKEAAN